jgi:peptidoglycan-associated lipoprotein
MIEFKFSRGKWLLKFSAAVAVLGFVALLVPARTQAQVSLFGGYSYMRGSIPVGQFTTPPSISQHPDLNGWEVSGEYSLVPFIGAVADFGGNYGKLDGANVNVNTYMFGPQLTLPGKISPFAHVLIGVAHERQSPVTSGPYFSLGSDSSFATAVGGGIDFKFVPFVAVRLIQVDYLHTNWHGVSEGQPRISAGLVLHF